MLNLMHFSNFCTVLICIVCMHDACSIISNTTSVLMQSLASICVCCWLWSCSFLRTAMTWVQTILGYAVQGY